MNYNAKSYNKTKGGIKMELEKIASFAVEIVKESSTLLEEFDEHILLKQKKDHADLVTEIDKKIESFLVKKITENYPEHGILGEEGMYEGEIEGKEVLWVIDPIDGTTNFIHGFPFYGISVGIVHEGKGVIGVVFNPSTSELFLGINGVGAFVNGERIELTGKKTLEDSLFSTNMFWEDNQTKEAMHPKVIQLHKKTRGIRIVGGAAISLTSISKGILNAYIMPKLSAWDFAGGAIFLENAGGIVTQIDGSPVDYIKGGSLIAAHPAIHKELVDLFEKK